VTRPRLHDSEGGEQRGAGDQWSGRPCVAPRVADGVHEPRDTGAQAGGDQQPTDHVDRFTGVRALGDLGHGEGSGDHGYRHAHPEHRVPPHVVDEQPANQRSDGETKP
jgi:hypothetical protein